MATNISPNSQDASLDAQSFASLLSLSLMPLAVPAISAALPLNLEGGVKGSGSAAGELPEPNARLTVAASPTALPTRKLAASRSEDLFPTSGTGIAEFIIPANYSNASAEPIPVLPAGFPEALKFGADSDSVPASSTNSQIPTAEQEQTLEKGAAGIDSSQATPTVPTELTGLATSPIDLSGAASASAPALQQTSTPAGAAPAGVWGVPPRSVAGRTDVSQAAPQASIEAEPSIASQADAQVLPIRSFTQWIRVAAPLDQSKLAQISGANAPSSASAVSGNASNSVSPTDAVEPMQLVSAEPSVLRAQPDERFAGRADQPDSAPTIPSEPATAGNGTAQSPSLPVNTLQKFTNAAVSLEPANAQQSAASHTTSAEAVALLLRSSTEQAAGTGKVPSPDLPTDAPQQDTNAAAALEPANPRESAAAQAAGVEAAALSPRPAKQVAGVAALPDHPAQPAQRQSLDAASRVQPLLASRAAAVVARTIQSSASDTSAVRASKGSSKETFQYKSSRTEASGAATSSPGPAPSSGNAKYMGGQKFTNGQSIQANDASSAPDTDDSSIEAPAALQSPSDVSPPSAASTAASLSSSAENSTSAAFLDTPGTSASNPSFGGAPDNSSDPSRNDASSDQGNRASASATDHKDAGSAPSSADTATAEPLKFGSPLGPSSSSPAGTVDPANGNAPASASAPISKGHSNDPPNASPASAEPASAQIPSAQVAAQIAKSDVKIAMHGGELGSMELHAKMAGEEVSASITVEHHDAHSMLTSDLPALHQALNDRQLRVSEILLLHNSLSSGGSSEDGPNAQSDGGTSSRQSSGSQRVAGEGSASLDDAPSARAGSIGIFDSRGRLSVRA
jgi:hypothetical protein